jgi:hypothetical protein
MYHSIKKIRGNTYPRIPMRLKGKEKWGGIGTGEEVREVDELKSQTTQDFKP